MGNYIRNLRETLETMLLHGDLFLTHIAESMRVVGNFVRKHSFHDINNRINGFYYGTRKIDLYPEIRNQ